MSTASVINGVLQKERDRTQLVPLYTTFISVCGLLIAAIALTKYDSDWGGLALFACAAIVTQLTEVDLFTSSRSSVSLDIIIVSAAIVVMGPWGAILVSLTMGLATIVTTSGWFLRKSFSAKRASWWRRAAFNSGIRLVAAASGAILYSWCDNILQTSSGPLMILPLVLFVIVYELTATLLLMVVIHLQTGRTVRAIWQQDWQWAFPITVIGGIIGGGGIAFAYNGTGIIGLGIFMLPIAATGYAFHLYVSRSRSYVDRLEDINKQLEQANLGLLQTLAAVVDAYDIYTFGHSAQVARYAAAIAEAMGLGEAEQARLLRGGLIHDLGKVGVADAIIGKTGRLTDEEYNALKLHTVIGAEIVSQMPEFQELVPLVRHHHERWDGRGYPDGLKGEENSLGARIMCVADSVEAMLSDRPYQSTRSLADVITEVKRCSGTQFDPQVVDAFLKVTRTHGNEFFVNSASAIARQLEESGALDGTLDELCYAKKSMISLHLQSTNATLK